MPLKVNNGHSFLHPVTGLMIGPGHFYDAPEQSGDDTKSDKKKRGAKTADSATAGDQSLVDSDLTEGEGLSGANGPDSGTEAGNRGQGTTV
jgi:hypothetical protein